MSPETIVQSCPDFASYRQEVFKDGSPGVLTFCNPSETLLLWLDLHTKMASTTALLILSRQITRPSDHRSPKALLTVT